MQIAILGGGLSGLSMAYFLQSASLVDSITVYEKEDTVGGLCRSFPMGDIVWDIGPHIIFSKNKQILSFMHDLLGDNRAEIRRSNRVIYKGNLVQYPFENDLSKLPVEDRELCVNAFLNNPYENYQVDNMLQFFLKTFGEGITNLYLRPYNEKIWKFDPALMDMQMVERIPKPPREDILKSAAGETIDGYIHQLYFSYPLKGGTAALIDAIQKGFNSKVNVLKGQAVNGVSKKENGYLVDTDKGCARFDKVISTIPVNQLADLYAGVPDDVVACSRNLRYNSIAIAIVQVNKDFAGDNFAFMIADKSVIFHRLSKIDFLGDSYHKPGTTTYMIEVTFRPGDLISKMSNQVLFDNILDGLLQIGFIEETNQVVDHVVNRFEYAYVIYDLMHQTNMSRIREYYAQQGIYLNGRFGDFEYLNMDAIIQKSLDLSKQILKA